MSGAGSLAQLVNKLTKLGDRLHLNREQALSALRNQVTPSICSESAELQGHARTIMMDVLKVMYNSARWEDRHGAIDGSIVLIEKFYDTKAEGGVDSVLKDFVWNGLRADKVPGLLRDGEFRVRNQLGLLLKAMISHDQEKGAQHFDKLKEMLLKDIEETFEREPEGGVDASADPSVVAKGRKIINENDGGKTMHDTEGWKSLETSMRILQHIIEAIGVRLYDFALDRILQCIIKGVDHINRFVREISYFVINAIFETSAKIMAERSEDDSAASDKVEKFLSFCDDLVPIVAKGLGDNWSQVRYAAS